MQPLHPCPIELDVRVLARIFSPSLELLAMGVENASDVLAL